MSSNKTKISKALIILSLIAFIFLIAIVFLYYRRFDNGNIFEELWNWITVKDYVNVKLTDEKDKWGTFGDYIGGTLNPILAFFSFMALLYTVHLQNEQIEYSKIAQADLEITQTIQRFENGFSNMFTQLINVYERLSEDVHRVKKLNYEENPRFKLIIDSSKFTNTQPFVYRKHKIHELLRNYYLLTRFCIFLYQILKYIDSQPEKFVNFELKKTYTNLVRAIIENNILQLLYFNCVNFDERDFLAFHKLVTKYNFFEHMSFEVEGSKGRLNAILPFLSHNYSKEAFGNSVYYERILAILIDYYGFNINQKLDIVDKNLAFEINRFKYELSIEHKDFNNGKTIIFDMKKFNTTELAYIENNLDYNFKQCNFELVSVNTVQEDEFTLELFFDSKRRINAILKNKNKSLNFSLPRR